MNPRKLRWGILGTAQIARKNWKAIQLSGNSTVTAVASRDEERSRRFIAECQAQAPMEVIPQAFGRYKDLLACEAVDAVYIPLPTGIRQEWVLRAAQAGKHVVCEKPCATSVADFQVNGCDFRMASHSDRFTVNEHSHGHPSAQETHLFRNFAAQALSGQLNQAWPEAALKTQRVMCACLDSARAGGRRIQPG